MNKTEHKALIAEKLREEGRKDTTSPAFIALSKLYKGLCSRKRRSPKTLKAKLDKPVEAEPSEQAHPESYLTEPEQRALAKMSESEREIWKEVYRIEAEQKAQRDSVKDAAVSESQRETDEMRKKITREAMEALKPQPELPSADSAFTRAEPVPDITF